MNDRFIFRAWDKPNKCFIPRDCYVIYPNGVSMIGKMTCDWNNYKKGEYLYCTNQCLTQCTGLRDKNGALIFEGDIVEDKRGAMVSIGEVEYRCDYVAFTFSGWTFPSGEMVRRWCSVIGNIYENPELLEVKP